MRRKPEFRNGDRVLKEDGKDGKDEGQEGLEKSEKTPQKDAA